MGVQVEEARTVSDGTHPLARAMEEAERRAWEDVYRAAAGVGLRGLETVGLGRGAALFAPGMDVLAMNRAFGIPADAAVLESLAPALVEAFRVRGIPRFFVQPSPSAARVDPAPALREAGLRPYNRWVRMYRRAGEAPWPVTGFDVVPAEAGHAAAFGAINRVGFDFPEATGPWIAALTRRPGWHAFVALEAASPVAVAAFHHQGAWAWMGFSATLPGHRGRGAQLALLCEMVLQASRAGCRHLVAETAEDRPDHPAPAYRNGRRAGFRPAYLRESWIWDGRGRD